MGSIKDVYEIVKELATDAKKMTDKVIANEFYSKLLDLQEKLLDVRQENYELFEENKKLKDEVKKLQNGVNSIPKDISWSGGIGRYKDNKDITHLCCQLCFINTNKIIDLIDGMSYVNKICPNCRTNYRIK